MHRFRMKGTGKMSTVDLTGPMTMALDGIVMDFEDTYMLTRRIPQLLSVLRAQRWQYGTETEPRRTTKRMTTSSLAAVAVNKEALSIAKFATVLQVHTPAM
jgi:hypothetical protein